MPPSRRNASLLAVAAIAAVTGGIFALQGVGVPIGRSFMIGDLRWTAIGLVLIGAAAWVAWREIRRR